MLRRPLTSFNYISNYRWNSLCHCVSSCLMWFFHYLRCDFPVSLLCHRDDATFPAWSDLSTVLVYLSFPFWLEEVLDRRAGSCGIPSRATKWLASTLTAWNRSIMIMFNHDESSWLFLTLSQYMLFDCEDGFYPSDKLLHCHSETCPSRVKLRLIVSEYVEMFISCVVLSCASAKIAGGLWVPMCGAHGG